MMLPLLFVAAACVPVHEPVLRAGDLFRGVDPSAQIGYAPVPGSRRVVTESEMVRLAKRLGVEGDAREVCFEWAMKKLSSEVIVEAMQRVLPGVEVGVVELPTFDVPEGALRFSLASLPKAGRIDEPVIWRGSVEYAPGRNFAVWAKVRLSVTGKRVELLRDLAAGETISSSDIELRDFRSFPGSAKVTATTEEVIGRKLLLGMKAGNGILSASLVPVTQMVDRGDEVTVHVHSGGALIKVSAKAESSGAVGQSVRLRNPKSGKVFEGKVTGKGTVSVTAVDSEEDR